MKKRICKIMFSSSVDPGSCYEITGEVSEKQILSPACEWVTVNTKYLLDNKIHEVQSIIHKFDIREVQFLSYESSYVVDKTSLVLMSPVSDFKGMEA